MLSRLEEVGQGRWLQIPHLARAVLVPEVLVQPPQGPSDRRVEVVFDRIISPSGEYPCDFFPLVADSGVGFEEEGFLGGAPGCFGDGRRELVVPPG